MKIARRFNAGVAAGKLTASLRHEAPGRPCYPPVNWRAIVSAPSGTGTRPSFARRTAEGGCPHMNR